QPLEPEVVAARDAEPWIAVRKRPVFAGAPETATFVPRNQLVAHVDHGHAHARALPVVAHDALALGKHELADAAALQGRPHGKHAEIAAVAPAPVTTTIAVVPAHLDVRASQQFVIALGQQHAA